MENNGGTDIHTAACGPDGYVWKEAAAHREPTQEQAPGRSCDPWRTRAVAVCSWQTAVHGTDPC